VLKIGELSKRFDLSVETLRFYERQGLISSRRNASGYRLYDDNALAALSFIARAKRAGFSLSEIADLQNLQISHDYDDVYLMAKKKLDIVEKRMKELQRFHSALQYLVEACDGCDHHHYGCTIMEFFDHDADK